MSSAIKNNSWRAFIGIALLSFGCYLDYTVVNVALPTIQQQLHASLPTLQWVMNIYFLALCVLATIMGKSGDLFGRRKFFYSGVIIFTLASVVAGFSQTINWLIAGRLLQGIGAALVLPLGPSLLPIIFPPQEHGKAIAWLGSVGGLALALGPIIGGVIVSHWGWRWIFFINIPLTLLGVLFCFGSIKESKSSSEDRSLDWVGMILLAMSVGGIVLSLIQSATYGRGNVYTLGFLIMAIVASIALFKVEKSQSNPLIDFKDFTKLLFFAGTMLVLLAGVLSSVALFFDPLYLQILRKQSPQYSGMILFVIPVTVFAVAFIVERLIRNLGIIHTILLGLFLGSLAGLLHIFFSVNSSMIYVLFTFIVLGAIWAMGNTVSIIAAQTAVGPDRASVATGTIVTLFNLGGAIGLAIAVVIYQHFSLNALYNTLQLQQYKLSVTQLGLVKQLIANPADSLQMQLDNLTTALFHHSFINGFTGVMCFLFILAGVLLLSVLSWQMLSKKVASA